MMETNFQRRAIRHTGVGSTKGSLSPKGTIKKKKQDRKSKERQTQQISNLNVLIGRLEDRDTQQQAFATLIGSLPELDPSMVKEVYSLIEKNKKPGRSSTRRMLVLLIVALCRCHPVQSAKFLPRILSYACLRLRDRHAKTTESCVILVSTIALYVLPCPTVSFPDVANSTLHRFEAVAAVFTKEANAVGEAAIRCLCGLLHPVDFDGVSVPRPSTILAHATRIRPFFNNLLADIVTKMDGSTMFATFSPLFLLLQSACQLARDAHEKGSFTELGDDFSPYIRSIYEAIEDSFQCGPRDNWMLRKRGLELLTLLLDVFALQESAWCSSVEVAKEFFQSQLERVRTLVLAGRHDSVSVVREAAISSAMTFECLEKLCPQRHGDLRSSASATSYDFVPPRPSGYSFTKRQWKSVANSGHDSNIPETNEARSESTSEVTEDIINEQSFDESAGDEASPSLEGFNQEEDLAPPTKQTKVARAQSTSRRIREATSSYGTSTQILPESTLDDEMFTEVPENGDEAENPLSQDEKSREDQRNQLQRKGSSVNNVALKSSFAEGVGRSARALQSLAGAMQTVETLKQFVAKQRAQTRSRHTLQKDIPRISLPKHGRSRVIDTLETSQPNHDVSVDDANGQDPSGLELTRAEAALEAAQCGEYELAFRLCVVEDDLDLLRRMMVLVKTPCMANLSSMAQNALCTAFLPLLDGADDEDSPDIWLVLQWLQQWAVDDRRQFEKLDPRIVHALSSKLNEMAMTSTKSSLAAAHVVFLLGI